jgi:hypothetical protein
MSQERNRRDLRMFGVVLLVLGVVVMGFGTRVFWIQTKPCGACLHKPHVELPCIEYKGGGLQCGCRRGK